MSNEKLYQLAKDTYAPFGLCVHDGPHAVVDAVAAAARAEGVDLEQFRKPVMCWRSNAHLGEIALDYRKRYLNSVDVYTERVAEADRLIAVIDSALAQQEPSHV